MIKLNLYQQELLNDFIEDLEYDIKLHNDQYTNVPLTIIYKRRFVKWAKGLTLEQAREVINQYGYDLYYEQHPADKLNCWNFIQLPDKPPISKISSDT